MKEDDTKQFRAKLGVPNFDKAQKQEEVNHEEACKPNKEQEPISAEEARRIKKIQRLIDDDRYHRTEEEQKLINAAKADEDLDFIFEHMAYHREFLSAVERISSSTNPICVGFLHVVATNTINILDELIMGFDENEREKVRTIISRRNASWPVNIESRAPAYLTNKASYIFEELELGAESILNVETFKYGVGDIAKPSKIVVRRFICAIMKCQLRARLNPDEPKSKMECLAVSLDGLDSYGVYQWFAVIFEWIIHYGKLDKDQETMSLQQIEILGTDISGLWKHAEKQGNISGDIYNGESTVNKELRKNLWRVFLQCIKPTISEKLGTREMKDDKWENVPPPVPGMPQHRTTIQQLTGEGS